MSRALTLSPTWRSVLAAALACAFGSVLGLALGWLSWRFWVIGLFGVLGGLAIGWMLAVATLWLGRISGVRAIAVLAIVASWLALQVLEDHNLLRANRVAHAELNAKRLDDLAPADRERIAAAGGVEFLAGDGDEVLEARVVAAVGFGGPIGRWIFRGQSGVRLAGDLRAGRALPVGVAGFVVASVLEVALAVFLALRIVRRARRVVEPEHTR